MGQAPCLMATRRVPLSLLMTPSSCQGFSAGSRGHVCRRPSSCAPGCATEGESVRAQTASVCRMLRCARFLAEGHLVRGRSGSKGIENDPSSVPGSLRHCPAVVLVGPGREGGLQKARGRGLWVQELGP